jgi:hypothetical protein
MHAQGDSIFVFFAKEQDAINMKKTYLVDGPNFLFMVNSLQQIVK